MAGEPIILRWLGAVLVPLLVFAVFATAVCRAAEPSGPAAPSGAPGTECNCEADLPIPVFLGNAELGQPTVHIGKNGELQSIDGRQFIDLLRPVVVPSVVAALQSFVAPDGRLPIARLPDTGLQAEYDPRQVTLRVFVPFSLRTPEAISIAARRPPLENVRLVPPAKASAYVNLRAAEDYLSQGGSGDGYGRQPAVVDFDGAASLLGLTLEGTATYRESAIAPWQRGDVRLIKDFPDDRNRLTFGDLNYGTTGFQSFDESGGISFSRNFDLQPYRISSSTAERTFTLTRKSDVDILVNGRRVRTVTLEPGRYNLRDLPLASGTNNIQVRVTDDVGRVETIAFPFVFDTNLLIAGEQEFSYALGYRSRDSASGKDYDTEDPVFSAFHAIGVNDHLTLGANLQAIDRQRIVGAEARLGTIFGVFRGDLAASNSAYAPTDIAARLQYRYTEPSTPDSLNRNLLANITYRGASFTPLGTTIPSNPTAFDTGVVYGQKLPDDWFGSLGLSVQFDRASTPESHALDLTLSRRLTNSLYLDILGRRDKRVGEPTETSLFLSLSWIPFESHQRVTVQHDTADRSTRLDWSYNPTQVVGGVQANLTTERLPEQDKDEVRGDVTYVDYRYEAQLRYDQSIGGDSTVAHRTTGVRLGTALVFADGHVTVSRPISDSFAMIVPHPTLGNREVDVNGTQAKTDFLGPAVLPQLPAYYVQRVTMDVPDVPPGYDLGDQIVNVEPSYRSGTVVPIGTGATAVVEGLLVDGTGKPITLQIGSVVSLDLPTRAPTGFFTDSTGRFQLVGLVPGRYELTLAAAPATLVRFGVPVGASGTFGLGTVVFPLEGTQ